MTDHSVYIGRLDDPDFKWVGGDWNNNVPKAITPSFPDSSSAFDKILTGIANGELDGKRTDFGGWVARMYKREILALINEWYPPGKYDPDSSKSFERESYERLMKLLPEVEKLDDKTVYALVAWEL